MAGLIPWACEFCGAGYGDLSTGNVVRYVIGSAHAELLATLKQASADLALGHFGSSLAFVLLLGGAYGSLHAIGPGHGKFAVAGYAMGSGDARAPLLRVVAGAGLAHVAGAALILLLALVPALAAGGTLPVEHWTRPIQGVTYSVLAIIGLWLIVRAARGGHELKHAHTREAHTHPASQWTLGAVIGAPPCTGSIIAAAFAIGHQAIVLGFAMIIAIAAGMAATLGGVGWTARALRATTLANASSDNAQLWWRAFEALGGGLLLLTGGVFAYASF